MKLTPYEQDMLDGKFGRFKQIALENVLKYARVVGAEELVEITKSTLYFGAHSYLETCDADTYDEIFAKMYLFKTYTEGRLLHRRFLHAVSERLGAVIRRTCGDI